MLNSTYRIARVRGIDVRVAPSWLLVAAAIVWTYQRSFDGDDRSLVATLVMAVVAAILFTASVLVHELAHALEGTHRGIRVEGIHLFLLGGATALRDPDRRAVDEFAIAAIGPWSNIVLAAVFGLLALYAGSWDLTAVADVAGVLGWLNLGLALFNLVPGAPLDGGRILRAAIWAVTGDRHRSTIAAAVIGILLSLGLIGWALWLIAGPGNLVAGIWIGLIGGYVLRAARIELARGRLALWLAGHRAGDLAPAAPRLTADASAADLRATLDADPDATVVLLDRDGEPAGVVERPKDRLEQALPDGTTAADHARQVSELPTVAAEDTGDRLVGLLDRDQPLVLITGEVGTWLSTLHRIDQSIRAARGRGVASSRQPHVDGDGDAARDGDVRGTGVHS